MIDDQSASADAAWMNGGPCAVGDAYRAAASLLAGARRPLITGLGGVSTEAQRVAVAIADRLGGVADWTSRDADSATAIAYQTVGSSTATYGEAAERADLVLYWRCPLTPLPGFPQPSTIETFAIGSGEFALRPDGDYEAIAILRAIVAGIEPAEPLVRDATGIELQAWRQLANRLIAANYAVIVVDDQLAAAGHAALAALTRLAQELHSTTRVVITAPPSENNRAGAANLLGWQTGYPLAVCFGQGYPRFGPREYETATLLKRREVDAALIASDAELETIDAATAEALEHVPRIVFSANELPIEGANVVIHVAQFNESGGSYYRADGPSLPLPKTRPNGPPTAQQALTQIAACLAS